MLSEFAPEPDAEEAPAPKLSLDSAIARMKADLDTFAINYRRAAEKATSDEDWPEKMTIQEWWEQWMCSGEGF